MSDEEEKKGFKVSDRRTFGDKKDEDTEKKAAEAPEEKVEQARLEDIPPIDFTTFILSLSSSVLIHLGEVPDPISQKTATNLVQAKQTVDILSILEEKTKGNLTDREKKLFDNLLTDLRMRYLKASEYIS